MWYHLTTLSAVMPSVQRCSTFCLVRPCTRLNNKAWFVIRTPNNALGAHCCTNQRAFMPFARAAVCQEVEQTEHAVNHGTVWLQKIWLVWLWWKWSLLKGHSVGGGAGSASRWSQFFQELKKQVRPRILFTVQRPMWEGCLSILFKCIAVGQNKSESVSSVFVDGNAAFKNTKWSVSQRGGHDVGGWGFLSHWIPELLERGLSQTEEEASDHWGSQVICLRWVVRLPMSHWRKEAPQTHHCGPKRKMSASTLKFY